ncbi:MAG: hypothetical protein AB7H86_20850 [Blastocatellales bacterium]
MEKADLLRKFNQLRDPALDRLEFRSDPLFDPPSEIGSVVDDADIVRVDGLIANSVDDLIADRVDLLIDGRELVKRRPEASSV